MELKAIGTIFHADAVRITVSQPGLDPQSPIYDPQYLPEIMEG